MSTEKTYRPINCGLYDYLEIACLYHYDLDILLRDGSSFKGNAQTTQTKDGAEFLIVQLSETKVQSAAQTGAHTELHTETPSQNPNHREIRLDTLARLTVTTANPQFDTIDFESAE